MLAPSVPKREGFVLVTLNELLLEGPSLDLIGGNVILFSKLAEQAKSTSDGLVVMITVPTETGEDVSPGVRKDVESKLETAGLFQAGLKAHRIVFTSTVDGRISVGRQMQASLFIDTDDRVVSELQGKVPQVTHVRKNDLKNFLAKVFSSNKNR